MIEDSYPGSSGSVANSSTVTGSRGSEIGAVHAGLADVTSSIADRIELLENRLAPILRGFAPPKEPGVARLEAVGPDTTGVILADQLDVEQRRLRVIHDRLINLIDRVAL